jgi:hypothetical protein
MHRMKGRHGLLYGHSEWTITIAKSPITFPKRERVIVPAVLCAKPRLDLLKECC